MKKVALLFLSILLLQSCYSFKKIENKDIEMHKKHKIITNQNKIKAHIIKITDSSIVVSQNKKEKIILNSEIQEIRKQKFSILKTFVGLPVVVLVSLTGLFVASGY